MTEDIITRARREVEAEELSGMIGKIVCAGCLLTYPEEICDRLHGVTKSVICPLCANYINSDIHGLPLDGRCNFHTEMTRTWWAQAKAIAGKRWKPPTKVD